MAGGGGERDAGRRQHDAARPALEQPGAQRALKAGDAMADGRGRDVQRLGRRLERAGACRELEGLQREKIPRRKTQFFRQNASAGRAIRVAAPALI
jgi:hypothetical protein